MAKILIVDDEANLVNVMGKLFTFENHTVTAVNDSSRAAELLGQEEFDLMITDVRMEPLDGMQLLDMAKEKRPGMQVIMITAYYSDKKRDEAQEQGAFAYIAKPFQVDKLLTTVEEALAATA